MNGHHEDQGDMNGHHEDHGDPRPARAAPLLRENALIAELLNASYDVAAFEYRQTTQGGMLPQEEESMIPCRIIAVGNQSTGKSSLLESLCGGVISLPKGPNTVTRSPIELSIRTTAEQGPPTCLIEVREPFWQKDLTEAWSKPEKAREAEFKAAYSEALQRMGVSDGQITDREVVLRITHSGLRNLTMRDLPGLPKPSHPMYNAVKKLLHNEVQKKGNIVLLNDWLFNNETPNVELESLAKLAGNRLLRVHNFVGGADVKENVVSIFKNDRSHGKGVFGVRLLSDMDRNNNLTVEDVEDEAFAVLHDLIDKGQVTCDPEDRGWFSSCLGCTKLGDRLQEIQKTEIITSDRNRMLFNKAIQTITADLKALKEIGEPPSAGDAERLLRKWISKLNIWYSYAVLTQKPLPALSPSKSAFMTQQEREDLQRKLYSVLPKVEQLSQAFAAEVDEVLHRYLQEEGAPLSIAVVSDLHGHGREDVTNDISSIEKILQGAWSKLVAPGMTFVSAVDTVVRDVLRNMVYNKFQADDTNVVPEHWKLVIMKLQEEIDGYCDQTKLEAEADLFGQIDRQQELSFWTDKAPAQEETDRRVQQFRLNFIAATSLRFKPSASSATTPGNTTPGSGANTSAPPSTSEMRPASSQGRRPVPPPDAPTANGFSGHPEQALEELKKNQVNRLLMIAQDQLVRAGNRFIEAVVTGSRIIQVKSPVLSFNGKGWADPENNLANHMEAKLGLGGAHSNVRDDISSLFRQDEDTVKRKKFLEDRVGVYERFQKVYSRCNEVNIFARA